jgi:hypothetical protein
LGEDIINLYIFGIEDQLFETNTNSFHGFVAKHPDSLLPSSDLTSSFENLGKIFQINNF